MNFGQKLGCGVQGLPLGPSLNKWGGWGFQGN